MVADAPGLLFLSDAYYPGWQALVDGTPAAIEQANFMFRAVAMGKGEHTVSFRYFPHVFFVGLFLSLISCLVLAFVAGWWANHRWGWQWVEEPFLEGEETKEPGLT